MIPSEARPLKLALATLAGAAALHLVLAACGHSASSTAQCQTGNCGAGSAQTGPGLAPSGAVVAFAGGTAPEGWLLCDGSAVSRTQYASLFAAIGTAHGSGDGATTFQLPDYRGRFLRGVDDGQKRDPDALTRTAAAPGGNAGDAVGSLEDDAFASHTHGVTDPGHQHGVLDPGHAHGVTNPGHTHGINGTSYGCFYAYSPSGFTNTGGGVEDTPTSGVTGCEAITASATGVSIQGAATGVSVLSQTTGITLEPAGASAETRPANADVVWIIKS